MKVKRAHILLIQLKENSYSSNIQKLRDSSRFSDFCSKNPLPGDLGFFFGRKIPLGKIPTSACKDLLLIKHNLKSDEEVKLQLVPKWVYFHSTTLFIIECVLLSD